MIDWNNYLESFEKILSYYQASEYFYLAPVVPGLELLIVSMLLLGNRRAVQAASGLGMLLSAAIIWIRGNFLVHGVGLQCACFGQIIPLRNYPFIGLVLVVLLFLTFIVLLKRPPRLERSYMRLMTGMAVVILLVMTTSTIALRAREELEEWQKQMNASQEKLSVYCDALEKLPDGEVIKRIQKLPELYKSYLAVAPFNYKNKVRAELPSQLANLVPQFHGRDPAIDKELMEMALEHWKTYYNQWAYTDSDGKTWNLRGLRREDLTKGILKDLRRFYDATLPDEIFLAMTWTPTDRCGSPVDQALEFFFAAFENEDRIIVKETLGATFCLMVSTYRKDDDRWKSKTSGPFDVASKSRLKEVRRKALIAQNEIFLRKGLVLPKFEGVLLTKPGDAQYKDGVLTRKVGPSYLKGKVTLLMATQEDCAACKGLDEEIRVIHEKYPTLQILYVYCVGSRQSANIIEALQDSDWLDWGIDIAVREPGHWLRRAFNLYAYPRWYVLRGMKIEHMSQGFEKKQLYGFLDSLYR